MFDPIVDTRHQATTPIFVYLTKKFFLDLREIKILLESPSSNMRELEIYLTKFFFLDLREMKILLESPSSNMRELEIPS